MQQSLLLLTTANVERYRRPGIEYPSDSAPHNIIQLTRSVSHRKDLVSIQIIGKDWNILLPPRLNVAVTHRRLGSPEYPGPWATIWTSSFWT